MNAVIFNTEMKRLQRSNALAQQSLWPMEMVQSVQNAPISMSTFKNNTPDDSLETQYHEDMQDCLSVNDTTCYLDTVQCRNLDMKNGAIISWVSVRGMQVYRRDSIGKDVRTCATHDNIELDNMKQTLLVFFPARGERGNMCNADMSDYKLNDCIKQYALIDSEIVSGRNCVQYPRGAFDIFIVKTDDTVPEYSVMIISKPLDRVPLKQ